MKKTFSFTGAHTLSMRTEPALKEYIATVAELVQKNAHRYDTREEALLLPLDTSIREEARRMAERYASPRLKYLIVIGIGGSNLGAKAVYDALYGKDGIGFSSGPKLLFLDTLSSAAINTVSKILDEVEHADEFLINLISKSGSTIESIASFELVYQMLERRFSDIASRVVCTTDVDSVLWSEGGRRGFGLLPVPALVGGRFSIFSSVGIFPLLCAGVDIDLFCQGGADMLHVAVLPDRDENYAQKAAEELFAATHAGYTMFNIFHFNPELESLGKWERQLIAESLGKENDRAGNTVHAGITPIVSIGSTDLHSMAQLYLGGPQDKFTMLIRGGEDAGVHMPPEGVLFPLAKEISGKSAGEIMDAILTGVKGAYQQHGLPFVEIRLSDISPYTLGLYMEWRMATVVYLAQLMNVNAFDQPNVEDYKKITRAILNQ